MTKAIRLSNGMEALVDDEDYERLSQYKWHADIRPNGQRYAYRAVWDGKAKRQTNIRMHREILNAPPEQDVDHRNRNGLDNRRSNIRICTTAQNCRNRRLRTKPYYGVREYGEFWAAYYTESGEYHHIGTFATVEQAAYAYNLAIQEHGLDDFSPVNDVPPQVLPLREPGTALAKRSGRSSRYIGVSWDKKHHTWRAEVVRMVDGKRRNFYLGNFHTEEAAAAAYQAKAQELAEAQR